MPTGLFTRSTDVKRLTVIPDADMRPIRWLGAKSSRLFVVARNAEVRRFAISLAARRSVWLMAVGRLAIALAFEVRGLKIAGSARLLLLLAGAAVAASGLPSVSADVLSLGICRQIATKFAACDSLAARSGRIYADSAIARCRPLYVV